MKKKYAPFERRERVESNGGNRTRLRGSGREGRAVTCPITIKGIVSGWRGIGPPDKAGPKAAVKGNRRVVVLRDFGVWMLGQAGYTSSRENGYRRRAVNNQEIKRIRNERCVKIDSNATKDQWSEGADGRWMG